MPDYFDRAVSPACQRSNSRQFQYSVRALAASSIDFQPFTEAKREQVLEANAASVCQGDPWAWCRGLVAWWFIDVHAYEVVRDNPAPGTPLPPLTKEEIRRLGRRCSYLKIDATLSDFTQFSATRLMDLGLGQSFTWYGPSVKIEVFGPADLEPVEDANQVNGGATGQLVADVFVEASAAPLPWSTGKTGSQSVRYTDSFLLTPSATTFRPVPPAARTFQQFQNGGAAAATSFIGNGPTPATSPVIGVPAGIALTGNNEVPGNACDFRLIAGAVPAGTTSTITYHIDV